MALLRNMYQAPQAADSPYRMMSTDLLVPDPRQPRSVFRVNLEAALADPEFIAFVDHLRSFGRVTTPLQVRKPDPATGVSMIISGERRWRAAKQAGLTEVPIVIYEEEQPIRLRLAALAENFFRADLSLFDRASYIQEIIDETGCTQGDLARQFGISEALVSKYLSIFKYSEEIRDGVRDGVVTDTETARFLQNSDEQDRRQLIDQARISGRPIQRRAAQRAASRRSLREKLGTAPAPAAFRAAPAPPAGDPDVMVRLPRVPEAHLLALLRHHKALTQEDPAPDELVPAFLGLLARISGE